MGWHAMLKAAQNHGTGHMDYGQAFSQLGHSVTLGILLMLLTIWVTQRTGRLQARSRDRDDSAAENLQGAVNVLFFCFGMTGVMILVEDNIARAFAIGAAIALVRFRIGMGNVLSSALLFSVVIGMACGVGNISIAWSIAAVYSLVTIVVGVCLSRESSTTAKGPAADVPPGQLVRNPEGNWMCHFPRYTATIDGVSGELISLLVKGDDLIRRVRPGLTTSARDVIGSSTSVAEFDSQCAGRSGLLVSHPDSSLWWHFFSDAVIVEYMALSDNASGLVLVFTRNLSALSRPYAARSRHLPKLFQQTDAMTGNAGLSAVTRRGTQIVFCGSDIEAISKGSRNQMQGITLSSAVGVRSALETQIGPAVEPMPTPSMP